MTTRGLRFTLISVLTVAGSFVGASAASAASNTCSGVESGLIEGNLTVESGPCLLIHAVVFGNVRVMPGADLSVIESGIFGNLTSQGAYYIYADNESLIGGDAAITGTTEYIEMFAPIDGPHGARLENNVAAIVLGGAGVSHNLVVNGNVGGYNGEEAVIDLYPKEVLGNLEVHNNSLEGSRYDILVADDIRPIGGYARIHNNTLAQGSMETAGQAVYDELYGGLEFNANTQPESDFEVAGDQMYGNLLCQGNSPGVTTYGSLDFAAKEMGQCAGFEGELYGAAGVNRNTSPPQIRPFHGR